ncbi:dna repair protein swi5 sae3 [Stemphylium lycopersici]|uniref:Dna repair protein swi5 sae3 n=1 Tax=Stemphylium lycopersici TaxID=183478 RepID=A0A364NAS5_STELY|nr:dna repair protein swi5 sae3 [Stemphylium lycopersici]
MAIEEGVTEVADSEEEPMTSSPAVVSDAAAADKLSARASAPPQERQDATQGARRAHQALAECDANIAAERTGGLDVDQNDASINVDASNIDHADIKPDVAASSQGEAAVSWKSDHNLELSQPCPSEQKSSISDMPMADSRTAFLTSLTEEAQFGKQPGASDISGDCSFALQDAHDVFDSKNSKIGEPLAAHASDDPASNCQEPPFMPGPPPDANCTTRCHENQRMAMNRTANQQENEGPTTLHPHCGAESVEKCEPSTSHFGPRVHDGASQPISQESDQTARQNSGTVHISENAVYKSPTMPATTPEAISALTAKAKSPNSTTVGITGSGPDALLELRENHRDPEHGDAQGMESLVQTSQMSSGDCWSQAALQPPAANVPEASPSTPRGQGLREKTEGRDVGEAASQPKETTGFGLDASSRAPMPTLDARHQSSTGASPTPAHLSPSNTPQEITLAELRAQKAGLLASLRTLPAIRVLMEEMASSDTGADGGYDEPSETDIMSAANRIVKEHIKLLHEYNELKDVGQGLMGLIADQRGVRIVEVQDEFGIDAKD